jgi:hypothetical protein
MLCRTVRRGLTALGCTLILSAATRAEDRWIELIGPEARLDAFSPKGTDWTVVKSVALDPANPRRFVADPGAGGVIYNGPTGRTKNILTKQSFGDLEFHCEFNVPKGSNSGVKFEGFYEIQIADSWGVKTATASHTGGIYPRSEMLPTYHHIDKGYPPKLNASKPPGAWQTLDVIFRAPRFDASGKKVANARIVRAVVNGKVVQEDVEVPYPTGDNWHKTEIPTGPILIQADHGPVAFRNVRVKPLNDASPKS